MITDKNGCTEPAGPRTLKEAMAERGLTAEDLAKFFLTDVEHAERWMNHESKIHRRYYYMLRDGFLRISPIDFQPIWEELRSVPNDKKANWERWRAKSLQSCPTLCDPIHRSPPGPAVPGVL